MTLTTLYNVYFTNKYSNLYSSGNAIGNMAISGVGLGFIHVKQMFWIASSCGLFIMIIPVSLNDIRIVLGGISLAFYICSLYKMIYLLKIYPGSYFNT
jgi:hypothetical protein